MTNEFNDDFQDWLRNTEFEYTTGNCKRVYKTVRKQKMCLNTIAKKVQILKLFLNEAIKANVNTNMQFKNFTAVFEAADTIYLNEDELNKLAQVGSPLAIENTHRNLLDMEDDE